MCSPRGSTCSLGDGPASATARGPGQLHRVCPPTGCEARCPGEQQVGSHRRGWGGTGHRPNHGAFSPPVRSPALRRRGKTLYLEKGRRDSRRPLSSSPPTRPGEGPGSPRLGPVCTAVRRQGSDRNGWDTGCPLAGASPRRRQQAQVDRERAGGRRQAEGLLAGARPMRAAAAGLGNSRAWRWGPQPRWRMSLRGTTEPEPRCPGTRSRHKVLGGRARSTHQGHPSVTSKQRSGSDHDLGARAPGQPHGSTRPDKGTTGQGHSWVGGPRIPSAVPRPLHPCSGTPDHCHSHRNQYPPPTWPHRRGPHQATCPAAPSQPPTATGAWLTLKLGGHYLPISPGLIRPEGKDQDPGASLHPPQAPGLGSRG